MSFGVSSPSSHRGGWLKRNATATVTVVGVVIVLVAISVGAGVALSAHPSRPTASTPTTRAPAVPASPTESSSTPAPLASGTPPPPSSGSRLSGTAGDLVDDVLAKQVFDATWTPFATAFATGATEAIAQYSDTDVQDAIAGYFGCGCGPWPTAYQSVNFSAPPQSAYPVSFLAEIHQKDFSQAPIVEEAVFTQDTAGEPWLVSYLVSYVGAAPFLTADSDAPAPTTPLDVSIVNRQLATFFQAVFDNGVPPTGSFRPSGSIKQETEAIIADRNFLTQQKLKETLTYSAGSHSIAFDVTGTDLMCGEIRSHSVTTSANGAPIIQPADQSTFGQELPAGSYSSLTNDGVRDTCWYVTTSGNGLPVVAPISFLGGVYSRVGTPA